jgi:hypothetical protein
MGTRYFFDLHNGDGHVLDEEGTLIASEAGILREVARILTDIARDEFAAKDQQGIITIKVRDAEGKPISIGSLTFNYETLPRPTKP